MRNWKSDQAEQGGDDVVIVQERAPLEPNLFTTSTQQHQQRNNSHEAESNSKNTLKQHSCYSYPSGADTTGYMSLPHGRSRREPC